MFFQLYLCKIFEYFNKDTFVLKQSFVSIEISLFLFLFLISIFWFSTALIFMLSSDIVPLFVVKGVTVFQNVLLNVRFSFLSMHSMYLFLVFLVSVLHLFFTFLWTRKLSQEGHLRYLFISLDLLNSSFTIVARSPLTYFDFKGACLCRISWKISVNLD